MREKATHKAELSMRESSASERATHEREKAKHVTERASMREKAKRETKS